MLKLGKLAVLRYGTPDYEIVEHGDHVLCAVTGQRIPLDELTYWSVEYQEAYRSAVEATAAYRAGGAVNLRDAAGTVGRPDLPTS